VIKLLTHGNSNYKYGTSQEPNLVPLHHFYHLIFASVICVVFTLQQVVQHCRLFFVFCH